MANPIRTIGLVLASAALLTVVDTVVTVVALPAIVADLDTTLPVGSWMTTGYILGLIAVIPLSGWLTDRLGDRRVYLTGLGVFIAASILAGFSPTIGVLIGLRVLQGLGGGVINPVGYAIALRSAPREQRGRILSYLGLPVLIGPVLGPPLAGLLVDATTWRWLFWINILLGGIILLVCRRYLPASSPVRTRARPDLLGAVLIVGGAALLVLACTRAGEVGRFTALTGLMLAAGALAFLAFAIRTRGRAEPLIRLGILRNSSVAWGLSTLAVFTGGYFGFSQILPAFAQGVRGDSVFTAGLLAIPGGIGVGLTLQIATRLVDRIDPRRVILVGVSVIVVGLLAVAWTLSADASYPVIGVAGVLVGIGSGATMMPSNVLITRDLTGAEVPAATTLIALVSQLGTAIGTAVIAAAITVTTSSQSEELAHADSGGLAAMVRLGDAERTALEPGLADALGLSTLVPAAFILVALILHITGMIVVRRQRVNVQPAPARRPTQ